MKKAKRDWTAIKEQAVAAARQLGHELGAFAHPHKNAASKIADCAHCHRVCFVYFTRKNGFTMGGSVLRAGCDGARSAGEC